MPSSATASARLPAVAARRYYRPELDVLRLVAFLSVFVFHAFAKSPFLSFSGPPGNPAALLALAGRTGMALFFTLSSFLITELLIREREESGRIHLKAFYVRRVLRIWPLYFAFLLVTAIGGWLAPAHRMETSQLLTFLLFCGNWYMVFHPDGVASSPADPLWSISLEEQFYLIWPLLTLTANRRLLLLFSAATIPTAWIATVILRRIPGQDPVIWYNSFVEFQYFGIGALLALALHRKSVSLRVVGRVAVLGTAAGLCVWATWLSALGTTPSITAAGFALAGLGCALGIVGFLGWTGMPKWAVDLGRISYGLYAFHWLAELVWHSLLTRARFATGSPALFLAVRSAASLATSIALAALSYRYLELPFLKLKERFTFVRSRAV